MDKKIRKKRCKGCNELFTPFNSLQKGCSVPCAISISKKIKADKDAKFAVLRKDKKERDKLPADIEKTKHIVHRYIRERDTGKPCISCGTPYKPDFDAGHFYSANKFTALKFDFDNIHGQCIKCNRYNEGEFEKYSLTLPNRIGQDRYDALVKRAKLNLKYLKKWTRTELSEIRKSVKKQGM